MSVVPCVGLCVCVGALVCACVCVDVCMYAWFSLCVYVCACVAVHTATAGEMEIGVAPSNERVGILLVPLEGGLAEVDLDRQGPRLLALF